MKVSYHWLQTFFKDPLPAPEKIAELFTFKEFEVESIDRVLNDVVLDVKVLPDRAPYALSHQGIAKELSALIDNNTFIPRDLSWNGEAENNGPEISVEEKTLCDRYVAVRIMNISKSDSPEWLKDRLASLDQRSINFLVDLTNFVMLDIGQPLHVFDAEKVKGSIIVRKAKDGEKMISLDNKEIVLDTSMLVIADEEGVLALAGVKGGKKAEVGAHTKHVILEAAHFDAASVRVTGSRVRIKTESSKRFENNLSPTMALRAARYFLSLLKKEDNEISTSQIVDVYVGDPDPRSITVSFESIIERLGKEILPEEIVSILNKAGLPSERAAENVVIHIPAERLDIQIPEDVSEEVGRIYGYENIEGVIPSISDSYEINSEISLKNKIRNFLINEGYSEVYTYALKDTGDIKIANPLALDKGYMRTELSSAIADSLEFNKNYADYLGKEKIMVFEIGNVFKKDGEHNALCVGIAYKKPKKGESATEEIKKLRDRLFAELEHNLSTVCTADDTGGLILHEGKQIGTINNIDGVLEMNLNSLFSAMKNVEDTDLLYEQTPRRYQPVSIYPYISRDIALWVPEKTEQSEIEEILKKGGTDLLQKIYLFDVFSKEIDGVKKTSYAWRLIFQSYEKTLSDDEIGKIMERISGEFSKKGWQVR